MLTQLFEVWSRETHANSEIATQLFEFWSCETQAETEILYLLENSAVELRNASGLDLTRKLHNLISFNKGF